MRPLLNIDAGELADEPEELYALAQIANVACGGHAGDDDSMRRAIDACSLHGTALGAHPSFPDRPGFGRVHQEMRTEDLEEAVAGQCAALARLALQAGATVRYAKLHGALYHAASRDPDMARACVRGIRAALGDAVTVIGPKSCALSEAAAHARLPYAVEAFADRGVQADGALIPRGQPGAMLTRPLQAAERARALMTTCDTLCVHGDSAGAVAIARAVREEIDAASP
jgi:UPF0271 protein